MDQKMRQSPFRTHQYQNRMNIWLLPLLVLIGAACSQAPETTEAGRRENLDKIKLPTGFEVDFFAERISGARSMTLGTNGTVFVGNRGGDKVYALPDRDKNGKADSVYVIAKNLLSPNGVAFRNGSLYVAEINRILRYDQIESRLKNPPSPVTITTNLPSDRHHGWKYLAFGPDGKLYVPVGAPCNICDRPEDPRYASILRMDPDGKNQEVFAQGIRNTVGFTWHPTTKEMWFTDNGRDWLGDDAPSDELNCAPKAGMHFGFPYCHQGNILDPEYGSGKQCSHYTAPAANLGPHVAALGLKFYTGTQFPVAYKNRLFIARHGSWNRSTPIGYDVVMATLEGNKVVKVEPFATGWLQNGKSWGRPVDVLQLPDGSILISDDQADCIYRITYKG